MLSELLAPLNAVRDHVGDLMLHARESDHDRAGSEQMNTV